MADKEQPKMHRLGSSSPELRPLFTKTEAADIRPHNEQTVEDAWDSTAEPDSKEDRRFSMILVGVATVAIIVALIFVATRTSKAPVEPFIPPVATGSASRLFSAEHIELAESALRGFLAAKTDKERLKFVLAPKTLTAQMADYYSRSAAASTELRKIESTKFMEINGHLWCSLQFSDQNFSTHLATLKEAGDAYLLDWESFVAYGEMPWDELCQKRPTAPKQMRVLLAHTPYYNFKYSDPTKYVAFRIESREPSQWLYGYVERESALHRTLLGYAPLGSKRESALPGTILGYVSLVSKQPLNVRLHFEADAGADNLAIIDEVIHTGWATPEILGEAGD
jgi:hypothetical protein